MKKLIILLIAAIMIFGLCACSSSGKEDSTNNSNSTTEGAPTDTATGSDGIGEDGKGEVIPLSEDEKAYLLKQTTTTWLAMNDEEKIATVTLIGRWREECESFIVEDYDDMVKTIDHQMEQYYKNGVDENLFATVCDIYKMDKSIYITE